MGNELTSKDSGAVAAIDSHQIGDILKPLIREIHLFDSYVTGTTHLTDQSVLKTIRVGDELTLQREAENRYDRFAILVLTKDRRKLGYVPERDNLVFARLMDAGKLLKAKITEITPKEHYTLIILRIYLVDL